MISRRFALLTAAIFVLCVLTGQNSNLLVNGDEEADENALPKVEKDLGKLKEGSRTDDEAVQREEEAIKLDGLSVAQMKELRDKAEKFNFEAEVNRMMKLIINSLYRNKEIFLRELISNASDALNKIRLVALTEPKQLDTNDDISIRIKADKDNHVLHITDSGIGMTHDELIKNLGTIAKSGTADFVQKVVESSTSGASQEQQDLIGQFGVGFYSAFLVADRVVVTSKSNDDAKQWIWESDTSSFTIVEDPRGNTLKRGTQISLHLKEEAHDFLEPSTLKNLIERYSQFIDFPIYMWTSKTETVEEPVEEDDEKPAEDKPETAEKDDEDEGKVEDVKEKPKKTNKVEKTTWDWELINNTKPIWVRKPSDIKEEEYQAFYKSISKDYGNALCYSHFTAEGEVSFKSLIFVPKFSTRSFQEYGKKHDSMRLYVRRVFITDDLADLLPDYLKFVKGVIDSDDLPLNVSRETLQQSKLLKVIKKKLVRKVLDMLKKLNKEDFQTFWKEYSTNIKVGLWEDPSNRTRLAKLLMFDSSAKNQTTLSEYVERMKKGQEHIYYVAGTADEVKNSVFAERLLKKGYEVLYLSHPADEHAIQHVPEFDGKKLMNVAKEGLKLDDEEKAKQYAEEFKPLTTWLEKTGLKDEIEKAVVSQRLTSSPCALVASSYGWSGNMERLMRSQAYAKAEDPTSSFYGGQKKTLEINPRHPVIRKLLSLVQADENDKVASDIAKLLFETSTIRSGYMLKNTARFADNVESLLRTTLGISAEEMPEEEPETPAEAEDITPADKESKTEKETDENIIDDDDSEKKERHEEL
uniref:Histidine kinase/HSP90-like ATPase domain-containing protein n=1 Tax=Romanomermis culicivorax TaxID=13658 RepID=A0A915KP40_ROMCU